jgi:hypothetical protein
MGTLILNEESIAAYKELMTNPTVHGLDMKPLKDCFRETENVTPKHILYEQYIELIQKPLPKVMFYIIMDEVYGNLIGKEVLENGKHGCLGYKLEIIK